MCGYAFQQRRSKGTHMNDTVTSIPNIERVAYADGSVGLRYLSPKRLLWLALFIALGTPAGCTGGIATAVGLFGGGRDAGSNLLIGLVLLAFTAALFVYAMRPTMRTVVAVPGQGLHTEEGNLPFADIDELLVREGASTRNAAGVVAVSKGREILVAHCRTSAIARALLQEIHQLGKRSEHSDATATFRHA